MARTVIWFNLNGSTEDFSAQERDTNTTLVAATGSDAVAKGVHAVIITAADFDAVEPIVSEIRSKTAVVPIIVLDTTNTCNLWSRFYNVAVCPSPSALFPSFNTMASNVQMLLYAITQANDRYYSKPYRHLTSEEQRRGYVDPYNKKGRRFECYSYNHQSVNRPNHGILHAMRKCAYICATLQFWNKFHHRKHQNFKDLCNPKDVLKLQIMAIFRVAGRLSEIGFSPAKPKQNQTYSYYRKRSSEAMEKVVKSNTDLFNYLYHGNEHQLHKDASLLSEESSRDKRIFILKAVHDLDLRRCKDANNYRHFISIAFAKASKSPESEKAKHELTEMAKSTISLTGDRIKKKTKRNGRVFINLSHNPKIAFDVIFNHLKGKNNIKMHM